MFPSNEKDYFKLHKKRDIFTNTYYNYMQHTGTGVSDANYIQPQFVNHKHFHHMNTVYPIIQEKKVHYLK